MLRVMIDTNIFISAALFPHGRAAEALMKALMPPYQPVTSDYVIEELRRKFREKFPDRMTELEGFLYNALQIIQIIRTPEEAVVKEIAIRDVKDRPILRAALETGADLLLTGDKDFLDASIDDPRMISVTAFLEM